MMQNAEEYNHEKFRRNENWETRELKSGFKFRLSTGVKND